MVQLAFLPNAVNYDLIFKFSPENCNYCLYMLSFLICCLQKLWVVIFGEALLKTQDVSYKTCKVLLVSWIRQVSARMDCNTDFFLKTFKYFQKSLIWEQVNNCFSCGKINNDAFVKRYKKIQNNNKWQCCHRKVISVM